MGSARLKIDEPVKVTVGDVTMEGRIVELSVDRPPVEVPGGEWIEYRPGLHEWVTLTFIREVAADAD
jgi:hypothetical protein